MRDGDGRILVVDDDEDIRQIVALVLEPSGYRVAGAVNGFEALARLEAAEPPALMLVDLMMPLMDGAELMRAIKANPRLAGIPVVVMSGHHAAREEALAVEASGFLQKPVELDELLDLVRRLAPLGA
jgi:chemosensory pili system protein ChpA (sensor histidine kinase/response regulator)